MIYGEILWFYLVIRLHHVKRNEATQSDSPALHISVSSSPTEHRQAEEHVSVCNENKWLFSVRCVMDWLWFGEKAAGLLRLMDKKHFFEKARAAVCLWLRADCSVIANSLNMVEQQQGR